MWSKGVLFCLIANYTGQVASSPGSPPPLSFSAKKRGGGEPILVEYIAIQVSSYYNVYIYTRF